MHATAVSGVDLWPTPARGRSSAGTVRVRRSKQSRTRFAGDTGESDTTWDQPLTHAPTFAVIEARKSLARLGLPPATAASVTVFLEKTCDPDSTVPSVAPDGDDADSALVHWVAGPMSIEVEVGPSGPVYFWAIDERGTEHSAEGSRHDIEVAVKGLVARMAARVKRINPTWRTQYLSR